MTHRREAGIDLKLRELRLSNTETQKLYDKYLDLNKYYNATKHGVTDQIRRAQAAFNSPDGKLICAEYFETARRIFQWYYRNFSSAKRAPKRDELQRIGYMDYKMKYKYNYKRRFSAMDFACNATGRWEVRTFGGVGYRSSNTQQKNRTFGQRVCDCGTFRDESAKIHGGTVVLRSPPFICYELS